MFGNVAADQATRSTQPPALDEIWHHNPKYFDRFDRGQALLKNKIGSIQKPHVHLKRGCLSVLEPDQSDAQGEQQPRLNARSGSLIWTLSDVSGAYGCLQTTDGGAVGFCITVQTGP